MEVIEEFADPPPCRLDGSFLGLSQEQLELGEDLLDGVEVGRVWRQEEEFCAGVSDGLANRLSLVAAKVVHDDDVTGLEGWDQQLAHIGGEPFAVDRPVEYEGGVYAVVAQGGDESHGAPVAVGCLGGQGLAPHTPAVGADHVGLGPGLIDEDQPPRVNLALMPLPPSAASGHVGPVLLAGAHGFF